MSPDLALDILAQPGVVLDPFPARRGHLHQDRLGRGEPALGQQLPVGAAAGAGCPWCSRAGPRRGSSVFGWPSSASDLVGPGPDVGSSPRVLHLVDVDGDREGAGAHRPAVDLDAAALAGAARAGGGRGGGSSGRPAGVWNPTRSAPSSPRMISSRWGSCMNSSIGGNGMCRKNPIRRSGRRSRSMRRHQLELVVLHPDRRPGRRPPGGRLGEAAVDLPVGLAPVPVEDGRLDRVVVERPDGRVGLALVVVLDLLGRQRHRVQPDAVDLERRPARARARRPSRPRCRGCAARIGCSAVTRPPGLRRHWRSSSAIGDLVHRQPVGDDDERPVLGHADTPHPDDVPSAVKTIDV